MTPSLESIYEKLHRRDYKLTSQRRTIVNTIYENVANHLSAEEVYGLVKEKDPDIGLATVYRTLDLLADLEILQKMNFGDGKSRYEFTEQDIHHHHHLICLRCGAVIEFTDDLLETLETVISKRSDFEVVDHQLKVYGFCSDCRSSKA